MNLESYITELLYNFGCLSVRVDNALRKYEGIKQIKDLINKDGSFNHHPNKIPNIGKKSVTELRSMRVWFVENYLTLHQENQNQNKNKYEVTIRAAVKVIIEAKDSVSAAETAWKENGLNDRFWKRYTVSVEQIEEDKT